MTESNDSQPRDDRDKHDSLTGEIMPMAVKGRRFLKEKVHEIG